MLSMVRLTCSPLWPTWIWTGSPVFNCETALPGSRITAVASSFVWAVALGVRTIPDPERYCGTFPIQTAIPAAINNVSTTQLNAKTEGAMTRGKTLFSRFCMYFCIVLLRKIEPLGGVVAISFLVPRCNGDIKCSDKAIGEAITRFPYFALNVFSNVFSTEGALALDRDSESKTEGERSALPSAIVHCEAFRHGDHLVEVTSIGISADIDAGARRCAVVVMVMSATNDELQVLITQFLNVLIVLHMLFLNSIKYFIRVYKEQLMNCTKMDHQANPSSTRFLEGARDLYRCLLSGKTIGGVGIQCFLSLLSATLALEAALLEAWACFLPWCDTPPTTRLSSCSLSSRMVFSSFYCIY